MWAVVAVGSAYVHAAVFVVGLFALRFAYAATNAPEQRAVRAACDRRSCHMASRHLYEY